MSSLSALTGVVAAAALATGHGFVVPPAASPYSQPFPVGHAEYFAADPVLDSGGTAHLAWESVGATSITSCTLPRGARICSHVVHLALAEDDDSAFGRTLVFQLAPGVIEVVAAECCHADPAVPITTWTSTDNGLTFGPATPVGSLGALDDATLVGGQVVAVGVQPDGLHEQAISTDATAPVTGDSLLSSDTGPARITATATGALLVAHESAAVGDTAKDTTTVQLLASPSASPTTALTLPGESLVSLVTGDGQTYLMTRVISTAGVLDPPVRVRHWNGSSFDGPYTLPIPGPGDDQKFSLAVDGSGRLHAFWVGSRESYRLWHSVSTNGGRTWHAVLLGDASNAAEITAVVDARGVGIALELAAGDNPAIVQPLLIMPTLSIAAKPSSVVVHGTVVILGHVKPAVSGHPVQIQRKVGSRWLTMITVHESSNGYYKAAVKTTEVGTYSYRAFVTGVRGTYDLAASPVVRVTVHSKPRRP